MVNGITSSNDAVLILGYLVSIGPYLILGILTASMTWYPSQHKKGVSGFDFLRKTIILTLILTLSFKVVVYTIETRSKKPINVVYKATAFILMMILLANDKLYVFILEQLSDSVFKTVKYILLNVTKQIIKIPIDAFVKSMKHVISSAEDLQKGMDKEIVDSLKDDTKVNDITTDKTQEDTENES